MYKKRIIGLFITAGVYFKIGVVKAGTLPWEETSNTIATSISGPLLAALALAATVLVGIVWAFSPSEGVRRAGPALFGLSIAGGAAILLPALWDISSSAGSEMLLEPVSVVEVIGATP